MKKSDPKNLTKRDQRKINKRDREREIRQTVRKIDELWEAYWKLGMVKLDAPRFAGFVRSFRLKEQARNRSDVHVTRKLLDMVNTSAYCKTKEFPKGEVSGMRGYIGRYWACNRYSQCDENGNQITKAITEKQYNNLNEQEKSYFYEIDWDHVRGQKLHAKIYRLKRPEWFYELHVKRFYIHEVPVLDSELESQLKYYQDKMDDNNWWPKYLNMRYGGDHRGDSDWNDRIRKFIFKTTPQLEMKEYHNDSNVEVIWDDHVSPCYPTPKSD